MIKWLPALKRDINHSINLSLGQKKRAIEVDSKLVDVVVQMPQNTEITLLKKHKKLKALYKKYMTSDGYKRLSKPTHKLYNNR